MSEIAIITGASSGIGKSFVYELSKRNFVFDKVQLDEVWILARREDTLEKIKSSVKEGASKIRAIKCDLIKEDEILKIAELCKAENCHVKLLVNCAGMGKRGDILDKDAEAVTDTIDLNCKSLSLMTRVIAPYMETPKGKRPSRIINVASSAAFLPQVGFAVYAASKSYVVSFSGAMDYELKPKGIRTLVVAPGPVNTEFQINATDGKSEGFSGFRKFIVADPDKLAKRSLKCSENGRSMLVYGLSQKLLHVAGKLLPHGIILWFERH